MPLRVIGAIRHVFGGGHRASRMHGRVAGDACAEAEAYSAMCALVIGKRAQRMTPWVAAGTSARSVRRTWAWNDDLIHHISLH
jgi:hypothetical protein